MSVGLSPASVLYWYKDHRQKTVGKSMEMSKVVAIVNPSELVPKKGMKGFDLKQANGRYDRLKQMAICSIIFRLHHILSQSPVHTSPYESTISIRFFFYLTMA